MNRHQTWKEIMALTATMQSLAKQAEWSEVITLESQRQQLISDFFARQPQAEERDWLIAGIRQLLEADRQLIQLGKQGMDSISQELQQLHQGQRASRAYQNIA